MAESASSIPKVTSLSSFEDSSEGSTTVEKEVTQVADDSNVILADILKEYDAYIGGSSMGKGFRRAARYYLRNKAPALAGNYMKSLIGSDDLLPGVGPQVEDAFYVCDLGAVVSQFYRWKKMLPRVVPYYAVKCNPDRAIIKTLLKLGCNFDCASRTEINLVHDSSRELGLGKPPKIIFANPCKPPSHIIEAVCKGVRMVTFDNVEEVKKCAAISKKIELVLRIVTDDTGSQCRLSSKFGAPKSRWPNLLRAAKKYGLEVVGVSFHVGSGCRDASRYDLALRDAKELFEVAERDYGFKMRILDLGGGFPGESHSLWNPSTIIDNVVNEQLDDVADDEDEDVEKKEGKTLDEVSDDEAEVKKLNFFDDIAEFVTVKIDEYFPPEDGVEVIGEPGRYLVAAAFTLVTSVTSVRSNALDSSKPEAIEDSVAAKCLHLLTRDEEQEIVDAQANPEHAVIEAIVEELQSYSKHHASQNLTQQEIDVWQDKSDVGLLEAPSRMEILSAEKVHTAEGLTVGIVAECLDEDDAESFSRSRSNSIAARSRSNSVADLQEEFMNSVLTFAAAGEAAVSGVVIQAVADSTSYQDEFAYYVNDGVYGAFNNLIFDHASVRPRVLRFSGHSNRIVHDKDEDKFSLDTNSEGRTHGHDLYASTIFGPTCDSIDVISRSILLPKLEVGDWLYFQNMGAYTCAAASDFNGFTPTRKFYVCSAQPEDFESLD